MRYPFKYLLFAFFLFLYQTTLAQQVCTGALGDPVININFGAGANFGPSIPSSGYSYISGTPNDGQYTVANTTRGLNGGWFAIEDHTPNDTNGYMMVINADNRLGVFYQTTITDLCPGTTYEFAAWIINILNYTSTQTKPNVTFTIENRAGTILRRYDTNDIPETTSPEWKQYATLFTTGTDSEIILKITNNGARGAGNDIALDDITFRACGPEISPSIGNSTSQNINVCEGNAGIYNFSADVSAGYTNPLFQWQISNGTIWTDILGQTDKQTTVDLTNATPGVYQYRLIAAEEQNINSVNCRVASSPLVITINPKPKTVASNNGPVCEGANILLNATEGTTFVWTGPNGFSSTDRSPIINNAQKSMSGIYTVSATINGCISTVSTTLQVLDPIQIAIPINEVTICENSPVQLFASGGTSYEWLPAGGLSNAKIANPIATLNETTTYTVTTSNGGCSSSATVTVTVIKNAVANAGLDRKVLAGQSLTLDGKVEGTNVKYYWTPSDYLDDATKLNPIATPPIDITYTLQAESTSGCTNSTDEVFIKVYPKISISNTFTPNGDGINDTWDIPAADAFSTSRVKIVNRNGNLIYQSYGKYKPWDGKFNGKDLPIGTYYYTIYFNDDFEVFSGWVFITR